MSALQTSVLGQTRLKTTVLQTPKIRQLRLISKQTSAGYMFYKCITFMLNAEMIPRQLLSRKYVAYAEMITSREAENIY